MIETITAYKKFKRNSFDLENLNLLSSITIGRVDFASSLKKDRKFVNSVEMKSYCEDIFKNAKNKNLKTALGGAVSVEEQIL